MNKSIKINGKILSRYSEILSDDALQFVEEIHNSFNNKRLELLKERKKRQKAIDEGYKLDFLNETKKIRDATWKIKNIPKDLLKRQVEITGPPVPKKMFISALNSGADCYMTDFEDSLTPTFDNLIKGQLNVKDAVNKKIDFIALGGINDLNVKKINLLNCYGFAGIRWIKKNGLRKLRPFLNCLNSY